MPAANVTVQNATTGGIIPTWTAIDLTNGADFTPAPGRVLLVRNTGGSSVNITFVTPGSVDGNAIADKTVAVAAGATRYFAFGRGEGYAAGNKVHLTTSAAADAAVVQA